MRIATWNCNSIRTRAERAVALLERHDLDVLALQETKCKDEQFPLLPFEQAGYEVAHVGLNQWNGVAIVSRVGLDGVEIGFPDMPGYGDPEPAVEARAIGATCAGVRIWSLYVPNGRDLDNPHYAYKLDWLAHLRDTAAGWLADDADAQSVLMGDWNIAPRDEDVWDPSFFIGKTHVSEPERAAFRALQALGLIDAFRLFEQPERAFSWWDYRMMAFRRNFGLRIDHLLVSPALREACRSCVVDKEPRRLERPSDHAPVVLELALDA